MIGTLEVEVGHLSLVANTRIQIAPSHLLRRSALRWWACINKSAARPLAYAKTGNLAESVSLFGSRQLWRMTTFMESSVRHSSIEMKRRTALR